MLVLVASLLGLMMGVSGSPLPIWYLMKLSVGGAFVTAVLVLIPRGIAPFISQLAIRVVHPRGAAEGKRVLVYGAGDLGSLYLDYLTTRVRSSELAQLVGFVDDDEHSEGRIIRGFRILGSGKDLPDLVRNYNIDEVIVAIDDASPDFLVQLRADLQELRVDIRRWAVGLS